MSDKVERKLVISVVQREDAEGVVTALRERGLGSTVLTSTGGFLRTGNSTVMTPCRPEEVDVVVSVIAENASERTELRDPGISLQVSEWYVPQTMQVQRGGASIWVVGMDLAGYLPLPSGKSRSREDKPDHA